MSLYCQVMFSQVRWIIYRWKR